MGTIPRAKQGDRLNIYSVALIRVNALN